MRGSRIMVVGAAVALTFAACSSSETTTPGTAAPTTGGTTGTTLIVTAPAGASNSGFAETALSAPAGEPLTIVFKNDEVGIPHNVQIFEGTDTTATAVFAPADNVMINGVAETTYQVPALDAGTYTYNCFSHPATMVGTLTVS